MYDKKSLKAEEFISHDEIIKTLNFAEENKDNLDLPFYGINKNKAFMPTVADTNGLDKSNYKIMTKGPKGVAFKPFFVLFYCLFHLLN
jgi:hypothetical protein